MSTEKHISPWTVSRAFFAQRARETISRVWIVSGFDCFLLTVSFSSLCSHDGSCGALCPYPSVRSTERELTAATALESATRCSRLVSLVEAGLFLFFSQHANVIGHASFANLCVPAILVEGGREEIAAYVQLLEEKVHTLRRYRDPLHRTIKVP